MIRIPRKAEVEMLLGLVGYSNQDGGAAFLQGYENIIDDLIVTFLIGDQQAGE